MAKKQSGAKRPRGRPPTTPEERENELIDLAIGLAEEQLRNGTASTQVIVHYLKLGSTREKAEREMLSKKTELVTAQADNIKSQKHVEELYADALKAMRIYSGNGDDDDIEIL